MYYEFEITVPITATKDNPAETECSLNYGILRKISLSFPAGVHRVTNIEIYRWERRIFPTNPDSVITSDDFTVILEEFLPIIEEPYNIVVLGWNNEGSYEHTIRCGFTILPIKATGAPSISEFTEKELLSIIGEYEMVGK